MRPRSKVAAEAAYVKPNERHHGQVLGGYYNEPPYSTEKEAEFYSCAGGGPVAFVRPSSTVAQPEEPASAAKSVTAGWSKSERIGQGKQRSCSALQNLSCRLLRSLSGVQRTSAAGWRMSHNDPERALSR
jgi:hypothetical protein